MTPLRLLTVDEVITLHRQGIELYGGSHGIRDHGLLESAVRQAEQTFDGVPIYGTIADIAALCWCGLVLNHPFIDGNKRVSLRAADVFLLLNGLDLRLDNREAVSLTLRLISHDLSREDLAARIRQSSVSLVQ